MTTDLPNWRVRCEHQLSDGQTCGERSHYAYRAWDGGWAMCCEAHGAKHYRYAITRTGGFGPLVGPDGHPRTPAREGTDG